MNDTNINKYFLDVKISGITDQIRLLKVSGNEFVSNLFLFHLSISIDKKINIDQSFLGRDISFCINAIDGDNAKWFFGIISNIQINKAFETNSYNYTVNVVPASWLLTHTNNCKIFQDKTITEIINEVLQNKSKIKFDFADVNGIGKNKKHVYCVQYNESDFNFISRLCERAGIFYYFLHKDNECKMIFCDDIVSCRKNLLSDVEYGNFEHTNNYIKDWRIEYNFFANNVSFTSYNCKTPKNNLLSQANSDEIFSNINKEYFSYPGDYETVSDGQIIANDAVKLFSRDGELINASSNYYNFASGFVFKLNDHKNEQENDSYFIIQIMHNAFDGADEVGSKQSANSHGYNNKFVCIKDSVPFKSAHTSFKPKIYNMQPAIVVGNSDGEINIDEYGRVKVQFYWDRFGKSDNNSSCWIRVVQNWAGKKWGMVFHPRVGDEVLVSFLDGDPDEPIIIGSAYNENNKHAYSLPSERAKSGIKTNTINADANKTNEISFNDAAGQEEFYLHAQKDFRKIIEHDETVVIKNGKQSIDVQNGEQSINVKGEITITSAKSIKLVCGASTIMLDAENGITINGPKVLINQES